MPAWMPLSPIEAQTQYRVPFEVASDPHNTFFGTASQPESIQFDMDGPWPFFALLGHKDQPDILTFQIHTVQVEALEFEGFNPLEDKGGYLIVNKQALLELVNLLESHITRLQPKQVFQSQMFREMQGEEVENFRLHPEWFQDTPSLYFYQVYDPLITSQTNFITLLYFQQEETFSSSSLHIKIAQFSSLALEDPSFTPLEYATARINLNHAGLQEFISLLKLQLSAMS